jgi:hypothetical protein
MQYFEVVLPDQTELARVVERVKQADIAAEPTAQGVLVRDPSHLGVILTTRAEG